MIQPPLLFKAGSNVHYPVLSFLTGFSIFLRAALRNLTRTEKTESTWLRLPGEHKGKDKKRSLFWHDPGSPAFVVPSPLHLLAATQPLSFLTVLVYRRKSRRTAFAVVFKCWLFLFFRAGRMSVIEPKDGRRSCVWVRYESVLVFLNWFSISAIL